MPEHELARFPPILQLILLGLLAGYVAVSLLARTGRFPWLWDDPDEAGSLVHVLEYTVVPALVLFAAAVAVARGWETGAPLDGGWTVRELTFGPITAAVGVILIVVAGVLRRRLDISDGSAPGAWIPLVAMLLGMALLAVGVTSLGRTVKRASPASSAPPRTAPARASRGTPPPTASRTGRPRPRSGAG